MVSAKSSGWVPQVSHPPQTPAQMGPRRSAAPSVLGKVPAWAVVTAVLPGAGLVPASQGHAHPVCAPPFPDFTHSAALKLL